MTDRDAAINYLTEMKRDLLDRKSSLISALQELNEELECVTRGLDVVLRQGREKMDG